MRRVHPACGPALPFDRIAINLFENQLLQRQIRDGTPKPLVLAGGYGSALAMLARSVGAGRYVRQLASIAAIIDGIDPSQDLTIAVCRASRH